MDFNFDNIGVIALIVVTGLSAGLCFTWANAITPGIGRLDDLGFLQAFQQMNRIILNPLFIIVFFGPVILFPLNMYLFKGSSNTAIWLLLAAGVLYFLGVVLVTIFGNVPLNEMLNKINLASSSLLEIEQLRDKFEVKWNRLHLIRTITSIVSFILLLFSIVEFQKN